MLYVTGFAPHAVAGANAVVRSLGSNLRLMTRKPRRVSLLGGGEVRWEQTPEGLKVSVPGTLPTGHAYVLKVECE